MSERATPEFWDQQWENKDWKKAITSSRKSRYLRGILRKYLPDKKSRILEGGCGNSHNVDAMDYWGYQAVGVDFAPKTIAKIKEVMPNLDVHCSDVRALNYENEYFDGYISLGVIEHFWEGYDDILREMKRVLKPGGYVFLTFPCVSIYDKVRILLFVCKRFSGTEMPANFYQFALEPESVKRDFEGVGFELVYMRRRDGLFGLTRYSAVFRHLYDFLVEVRKKSRMAKCFTAGLTRALAPFCGHIAFMIFKKR